MTEMDPETLFPPKPGGMVTTVRAQRAAEAAQAEQLGEQLERGAGLDLGRVAVPVAPRPGPLARARTFSVATNNKNPIVELLGRDDRRAIAHVMTLDEPVVISYSQQAAEDPRNPVNAAGLSANGFTLPVNVVLPVNTTERVYCVATSSTATRVSVQAFSYAED